LAAGDELVRGRVELRARARERLDPRIAEDEMEPWPDVNVVMSGARPGRACQPTGASSATPAPR
jgi:hypothetical protein